MRKILKWLIMHLENTALYFAAGIISGLLPNDLIKLILILMLILFTLEVIFPQTTLIQTIELHNKDAERVELIQIVERAMMWFILGILLAREVFL